MRYSIFVCLCFVIIYGCHGDGYGKLYNNKVLIKRYNETSIKYLVKQNEIIVPVLIHIDKLLARRLSKNRKRKIVPKLKHWARDTLKDVGFLFSKLNLEQKIKFFLLDVKILKNDSKVVSMDSNVSKYMKSYCLWQRTKKNQRKNWWFSVLFTGLDLYYYDKYGVKTQRSASRGYMRGICHPTKSCTLLEWRPENAAFMLAHEIAHSLGVEHDGPPKNECEGQRHVMFASHNRKNPATSWSTCSKRSLVQFLKSKYAWCLQDPRVSSFS